LKKSLNEEIVLVHSKFFIGRKQKQGLQIDKRTRQTETLGYEQATADMGKLECLGASGTKCWYDLA
jgi:hypothetical protein